MTTMHERIGNRRFAGAQPTLVLGPVHIPGGVEGVRSTLRAFAAEGPHTRVGLVPDRASSRWAFDTTCDVLSVTERPEPAQIDVAEELIRIGGLPSVPIRVEIVGDHLVMSYDHGLGDAVFIVELAAALTNGAQGGFGGLHRDDPVRVTDNPALRALAEQTRRDPRSVASAVLALGRTALSSGPPAPADHLTPDAVSTVEFASSAAGYLPRLRAYRDRHHPGSSIIGLVTFFLTRALLSAGIPVHRHVEFMVNLRRYLPSGDVTMANFVGVTRAQRDSPETITANLRTSLRTSDLVVHQAAADTLARVRPAILDDAHLYRHVDDPEITLVVSDLTPHPAIDTITWKTDSDRSRVFAVVSANRRSNQINVVVNRMDDELHVTACFIDGAVDRSTVRAALEAALSDPPRPT